MNYYLWLNEYRFEKRMVTSVYQELGFHSSYRVLRNLNVKKLLKKPSVTSTLVVCKSPIHIFKRMVVIYRSMEHHLTYTVSMLLKRFPTY